MPHIVYLGEYQRSERLVIGGKKDDSAVDGNKGILGFTKRTTE